MKSKMSTYTSLPASFWNYEKAASFPEAQMILLNDDLALSLNLELSQDEHDLSQIFSGQKLFFSDKPMATAYAGHQFGHFVPRLGDGRALILGEVENSLGKKFDIQLKGSGPTTFSRRGDGFSAIGPVIREYLVSEFMHNMQIPTTRSLAAVRTGHTVWRGEDKPGGILTRVASSHLRVGSFEFYFFKNEIDHLRQVFEYALKRHDPELFSKKDRVNLFIEAVAKRQLRLVAQWMSIGFIHGVMNTDNMSVSGETIDYGPCAFMDRFQWDKSFSSIDELGRYAFHNQPAMAMWNLSVLAESLMPLISSEVDEVRKELQSLFDSFSDFFRKEFVECFAPKLGLTNASLADEDVIRAFLDYLHEHKLHFTQSFAGLHFALENQPSSSSGFPRSEKWKAFVALWQKRVSKKHHAQAFELMKRHNPQLIPQNHWVEKAIEAAEAGEDGVFLELHQALKTPFVAHPEFSCAPEDNERVFQTFCGT